MSSAWGSLLLSVRLTFAFTFSLAILAPTAQALKLPPRFDCGDALNRPKPKGKATGLEGYGIKPDQIKFTRSGKPVVILGEDDTHFTPGNPLSIPPTRDPKKRNIVIVGAGLAGCAAGVYSSDDPNHQVLILETQKKAGGLAAGVTILDPETGKAVPLDNGAAYWAPPDRAEYEIMRHLGLSNYKRFAIPEHIDTYLLYGKLYPGIWDTETVKELPKDFPLFKFALKRLHKMGLTPHQPMNDDEDPLKLDKMTAAQFIRKMPKYVASWIKENPKDTYAKHILNEFNEAIGKGLKAKDPMSNVIALMDNYCRSAHGATADKIDAHEFLNFYVSELGVRYTGPLGTGEIAAPALEKIAQRKNAELKTSSQVIKVATSGKESVITYVHDNHAFEVVADQVIFAASMKLAPRLIEGYACKRPDSVTALEKIGNSDYLVVNVVLDGKLDRTQIPGYDIWLGPPRDRKNAPTDVINATWMLPEDERPKNMDVMTVYYPLGDSLEKRGFTDQEVLEYTEKAQKDLFERLGDHIVDSRGRRLKAKFALASRWPFSIPVNGPGHADLIEELSRPFRNIHFAALGLDTPSVEAGLYYGKKSALAAIKALHKASQTP